MLYLVSDEDHFNLYQFISGKEKNHQNSIKPLHHLIGDLYIGKSLTKYGFICDKNGFIKHWLGFNRIGSRKVGNKDQVFLVLNKLALTFDDKLNEDGDLIRDIPDSNHKLFNEYALKVLYVVDNKGITEFLDDEPKKVKKKESSLSQEPVNSPASVIWEINGLKGYQRNGITLLDPVYEEISEVKNDRLIVKINRKKGLIEILKNTTRVICKPIFQDIEHVSGQLYSVLLDDGVRVQLTESVLGCITEMVGGYLIRNNDGGNHSLMYHNKTVWKCQEIRHLARSFFIVKEHSRYGIIRCNGKEFKYFRICQYKRIEISEDKRNILLYKEGRPRFIPLTALQ
jgi:hypothetical protein